MKEFNPRLHGLRALAALGVLIFHWAQFFPVHSQLHANTETFGLFWHGSLFIGFGWIGVPLFFVLSGYLLTEQWRTRPVTSGNLLQFWRRRFLRIYPAVWLQIVVLLLLAFFFPALVDVKGWDHLLANVLLFLYLPPFFFEPINGVWWTLPVELGFYLLLPGLIALQRSTTWLWIGGLAIFITLLWRYGLILYLDTGNVAPHQVYLDALPGSLVYFCAGFIVAYLPSIKQCGMRYGVLVILLVGFYLALVFLAFRLDSYWAGDWLLVVWPVIAAFFIAGFLWLLLTPLPGTGFLASRPLVWLGEISFGLYLWHFPVFQLQKYFWPPEWQGLGFSLLGLILALLVTCLLAELSFRWVENPLMHWRRGQAARE